MAFYDCKPVGRVLAINSHKANKKWNSRTVRFSMLDFVDDTAVSEALLRTVEEWHHEHHLQYVGEPAGPQSDSGKTFTTVIVCSASPP